jgi:hypothetical protein
MLPNLQSPEFKTTLPSTGEDVFFRPFLVKEEKKLLMALEGNNVEEIQNAILGVLTSCVRGNETPIEHMAFFDIEYLFLQLRSKSVNNIVKFNLRHSKEGDCDFHTPFELNLDDVEVVGNEDYDNKIMLDDSIGVVLSYPTISKASSLSGLTNPDSNVDQIFKAIANNIEYVFDEDSVYDSATLEEKTEFLEKLTKGQFDKIIDFYNKMPGLHHKIEYVCEACGEAEVVEIKGLVNFFG